MFIFLYEYKALYGNMQIFYNISAAEFSLLTLKIARYANSIEFKEPYIWKVHDCAIVTFRSRAKLLPFIKELTLIGD